MLINAKECIMADFDLPYRYRILYILMHILTARWEGKQGGNMAKEMLISAEESVMANFDLLYRRPLYFNARTYRQVGGQAGRQHGRGDAHQRQ
jgi:hypothetical protein